MKQNGILGLLVKLRFLVVLAMVAASGWFGDLEGTAVAVVTFFLIIFFASQVLFEVYSLRDRWLAFQMLFAFMFGIGYPYLLINEGKIDERSLHSPMAKRGGRGPGVLIVGEGSAVLMERHGGQLRIGVPGTYFITRSERVRGAVDLRLQRGEYELDNVFTRDGIPLHVRFTVLFRIIQSEAALVSRGRYEMDGTAVTRALLSARDWRTQTEVIAKARLRDTIAEYHLDALHAAFLEFRGEMANQEGSQTPRASIQDELKRREMVKQEGFQTPRVPLQEELKSRLNEETKAWGVEIVKIALDEVRMPEDIIKQMLKVWEAHWQDIVRWQEAETEARAAITRAEGRAEAAVKEAEGKKKVAETESKATLIEAQAEADARILEGRADAEARAEIFRRVVGALQVGGRPLDESTLRDLTKVLVSSESSRTVERAIRQALSHFELSPRVPPPPSPGESS